MLLGSLLYDQNIVPFHLMVHAPCLSFSTKPNPNFGISDQNLTPLFNASFKTKLSPLLPHLNTLLLSLKNMGFPVGYTELLLPKMLLQLLSLLGLIRKLLTLLLCYMGFHDFFQPDIAWPEILPELQSMSAVLIREILPVVKFSEISAAEAAESCAVCLYEFEGEDEIRRLTNCRHIFHRGCLDRWMGYDQRTCPLCRTPFIPHHMQAAFNDRLWAASGIPQFHYHDE